MRAAAVIAHLPGPRVLWVRNAPEVPHVGGFHGFPGGRVSELDEGGPCTGGDEATSRIAALRELFEEVGLLVVDRDVASHDRAQLREAFQRDGREGAQRFRSLGLRWDTQRLEPIGRWVSPSFSPIVFDTRLYGLRLDEAPAVSPDGREVERVELVEPRAALAAWAAGEVLLPPSAYAALRVIADRGFDADALRRAPGADGRETLRYEVVPALQLLPLRTPTLPPATHTNAFLVGSREAVLVEPASPYEEDLDRAVRWVEENAALGVRARAIVATHHHPDHIGGAVQLKERLGLPLWGHALTAERLRGIVTFERTLAHGERIELDGPVPVSLRAVHTPGHAPGHLCFVEERSRAMIAGDMVAGVGTILIEPVDGDMALYLDSLHEMARAEPSMLLPAHGGPIGAPQEKLESYVRHRLWREERVLAALAARRGPSTPADLVPEAYADAPAIVWPLAAHAAEAHLIKLERDGKAVREAAGWRAA